MIYMTKSESACEERSVSGGAVRLRLIISVAVRRAGHDSDDDELA